VADAQRVIEHWFYHLERSTLADALPPLLEKARAKGWRAFVRAGSAARLDELDDVLWTYSEEAFLPHGRADKQGAERQPILLSRDDVNLNRAQLIVLLDGAPAPGDLSCVERCVIMFDGEDEVAVHAARQTWKSLKTAGAAMSYWRQAPEGGWREEKR
jgi:DNA polymerase-3 subunit chi